MFDGIASGVMSLFGGDRANRAQRKMASQQSNFQERMSNTAYRRAMEDMKGAGLNPILAYQQGGASTPSGSMANQQDTVTPAVSTAMQYQRTKAEIQNLKELNEKIKSDTILNHALVTSAAADANLKANSALKTMTETKQLQLELPGFENRAWVDSSVMGKGLSLVDKISAGLGSMMKPIKNFSFLKKSYNSADPDVKRAIQYKRR